MQFQGTISYTHLPNSKGHDQMSLRNVYTVLLGIPCIQDGFYETYWYFFIFVLRNKSLVSYGISFCYFMINMALKIPQVSFP